MKYRLLLLLSSMLLSLSSVAQSRYFFYVRFDPTVGDASTIVEEIDKVVRSRPEQLIVMLSRGQNPIVADLNGWKDVRQSILSQQNVPSLYADREEDTLNSLFTLYLHEHINQKDDKMLLYGEHDREWSVCFILSEQMYNQEEDYERVPLEFSKINQLVERGITVHWYSYGESGILEERDEPHHPFYEEKK